MDNNKKFKETNNPPGPSDESATHLVTIDDLNHICLAEIFSYLDYCDRLTIEEVCRKWREIGAQFSWNNIKEFKDSNFGGPIQDVIKLFKRCGPHLKSLSSRKFSNTNILRIIGAFCSNLIEIHLNFKIWNSNDFVRVFYGMKNLTTVQIRMDWSSRSCDGYELLKNLPETIRIFLTEFVDYDSLTEQDLEPLSEKLGVLQELTLQAAKLDNQIMEWIMKKKSLEYLDLEYSYLTGVCQPTASINLPNLYYLELFGFYYLDDNLIINLIDKCKQLKYFNIDNTGNERLPQRTVHHVGSLKNLKNLKNLEELYLSARSDFVTDRVVENIKNLKVFECANCKRITDRSIIKIITNSWRLQRLNVVGTNITAATLKHADLICKSREQMLHMIVSERIMLNQTFDNEYFCIESIPDHAVISDNEEPSDDDGHDDDDDDPCQIM